jgi:p-aminobenzoyl-glutamate transporter AbgT
VPSVPKRIRYESLISMRGGERKSLLQHPKVVERYFRLRVHTFSSSLITWLVRRIMRPRLTWSERKRRNAVVSAIESIAHEAARSKRHNFQAASAVFNLALFFLIAERDIQTLKIDALTHPDAWKRSLCSRVILLTIYDLDIDKVAGNMLRQAIEDARVPKALRQEVALCLRSVRNAQQKAKK